MNRRDNDILITVKGFEPAEIRVPQGTEVNFINTTENNHKVISVVETFESEEIPPQEMFSYVFDTPGTHNFYCAMHKNKEGRVIVD